MKAISVSSDIISKLIKHKNEKKINTSNIDIDKFFKLCYNKSFINTALDADLLIFIRPKMSESDAESNFQTYIAKYDEITKRPTVGAIIVETTKRLNPIKLTDKYQIRYFTQIFLHLFTHILGFRKNVLESKNFLLNTSSETRIDNKKRQTRVLLVNNTKIVELARNYYNCNEINGIELDIYFSEQVISEFTLTLIEELGWYEVNYYSGGLMKFGKNKGCDFLQKDCVNIIDSHPISIFPNEFCSFNSVGTCSSGRISRGYCFNNNKLSLVNNSYRRENWFSDYGIKIVEYCPVSLETKTNQVNSFIGNCNFGNSSFGKELHGEYSGISEYFGAQLGNNSFCALSSIIQNNSNINGYQDRIRPTCYSMICSNKSLTIQLLSL